MAPDAARQPTRVAQHRRRLAMACAALVLGVSTASAQAPPSRPTAVQAADQALNRAQIDALLAAPDKVLVLDVRRPDEISAIGGFPAYLNVQAAELERYLAYVPRDRRILTVSNHAARAKKAAALLASRGFQVAGAAGAQDYAAQGGQLTIVKPPPPATAR